MVTNYSYNNMANNNIHKTDEQIVVQNSEFLKRVNDFASYMNKEYISQDGDDIGMLVCAADTSAVENAVASVNIVMGSKMVIAHGLSSMMQDEDLKGLFHAASKASEDEHDIMVNISSLRKRLRMGYLIAAFCAVWIVLIIAGHIAGVADLMTTVSSLALMAVSAYQLYPVLRDLRRKIRIYDEEQRQAERRRDQKRAAEALAGFLREMCPNDGDDDNDY